MWPLGKEEFVSRIRALIGLGEAIRAFRVLIMAAERMVVEDKRKAFDFWFL